MIATSAEGAIMLWNYDTFKPRGVLSYKNNEIRCFEFVEERLLIMSIDSKGYLILWDLHDPRIFDYYQPTIKVLLKPDHAGTLLVNNMIIKTILRESILEQEYDHKDKD